MTEPTHEEKLKRFLDQLAGKAQRDYRHGPPSGPHDEGSLSGILTVDRVHRRIRLDFGKSLTFIEGTPEQMVVFAQALLRMAEPFSPLEQPAERKAEGGPSR